MTNYVAAALRGGAFDDELAAAAAFALSCQSTRSAQGTGRGKSCAYCERQLEPIDSVSKLAATRDHVHPQHAGGRISVWACRQCNHLKGGMLFSDWRAFMAAHPKWWTKPDYQRGTLCKCILRKLPERAPPLPPTDRYCRDPVLDFQAATTFLGKLQRIEDSELTERAERAYMWIESGFEDAMAEYDLLVREINRRRSKAKAA